METLVKDLHYALRMMAKSPGFTIVAALSLALGIGANTAVFTVINGLLFKPLPVNDPERLVTLYTSEQRSHFPGQFSYVDYSYIRDHSELFSDLMAHDGQALNVSGGGGQPEMVWGEMVSGNYFAGLRADPALGRTFLPEEGQTPGAHPVAVLSYGYWQRRFGSKPDIVGQSIKLNGHSFTVVGVAPKNFTGLRLTGFIPDIWVPLMMHVQVSPGSEGMLERGDWRNLNLAGRLKPGVDIAQAQAELNTIAAQLEQAYPKTSKGMSFHAIPGGTKTEPFLASKGILSFTAALTMAVVGMVLLIACANVANLLLARATARRKEIAIRMALGASRSRLIRQLLTESVLLSLMGAALGLVLALWMVDLLVAGVPQLDFAIGFNLDLDKRVLGFTLLLSLVAAVAFGLAPALGASRPDLVPALKDETNAQARASRRLGLRNQLVVAQVALSLLLLICAGLFLKSAANAQKSDLGFDTKNILLSSVDLGLQGYDESRGKAFYKQAVQRVEAIPGVQSASVAFPLPMDAYTSSDDVVVEGQSAMRENEEKTEVFLSRVGFKYFETMGTPLIAGRDFTEADTEASPKVAVINETMARKLWPDQEAIGKRFHRGGAEGPLVQVVGVVKDGKYITPGEDPLPYMFLPLSQGYRSRITIIARTAGDPRGLIGTLRREVQLIDEELPVFGVKTMTDFLERMLSLPRVFAQFMAGFGLLALALATIGIYGVMNYTVSQRRKEIGIRLALGARPADVLRMVIKQGMALTAIGVIIGLVIAFAATRILESLLYGVSATDPVTFAVIALVLAGVALGACFVPARRAMKVDPMVALRYE